MGVLHAMACPWAEGLCRGRVRWSVAVPFLVPNDPYQLGLHLICVVRKQNRTRHVQVGDRVSMDHMLCTIASKARRTAS